MLNFDFAEQARGQGGSPRKPAAALSNAKPSTRVLRPSGKWIIENPNIWETQGERESNIVPPEENKSLALWTRGDGHIELIYGECDSARKHFGCRASMVAMSRIYSCQEKYRGLTYVQRPSYEVNE
jgi:hypothetical protein